MAKLLRIGKDETLALEPAQFVNEVDDLQSYIKKNQAILGDGIVIIAEQLDTGSGNRLDMLALEEISKGVVRPVVVELKNVEVDTDVLLQVLKYADWALSNKDSIKLYAEKSKLKAVEVDNSSVKVIIVAPIIKSGLLELSNYIIDSIDFGFLQFERFRDNSGDIVVLDWKAPEITRPPSTTIQAEWNWEKYEKDLKVKPQALSIAKYLYESLVKLNEELGWGLSPVFRKYYIPFKKSGYNIVVIELWERDICFLVFQRFSKSPEALGLSELHPEFNQGYNEERSAYWFEIPKEDVDVRDFMPFILKAVELVQGV